MIVAAVSASAVVAWSPGAADRLLVRAVHAQAMRRVHRQRVARWRRLLPGRAVAAAMSQLGVPYVWGAEQPGAGFDCSGLVQWAYQRAGGWLPRTTWAQTLVGHAVALTGLRPGDLVFAEGGAHVGLYVGRGLVLNAPYTGAVVSTVPLASFGGEWARRVR